MGEWPLIRSDEPNHRLHDVMYGNEILAVIFADIMVNLITLEKFQHRIARVLRVTAVLPTELLTLIYIHILHPDSRCYSLSRSICLATRPRCTQPQVIGTFQ